MTLRTQILMMNQDINVNPETEAKGINEKDRMIMTVKRKRKMIIPMMRMKTMTLMMGTEIEGNPKDGENEMNQKLQPKITKSFSVSISKQKRTVRMQSVTPKHFVLIWRICLKRKRKKTCLRSKRGKKEMESRLISESLSPQQCILPIILMLSMT